MFQARFVTAIHEKRKIRLTFYSKEDAGVIVRTCAPMDYGPSRRAREKNDRYHLWNYESDTGQHILSVPPEQVQEMTVLDEHFEPGEFVTWSTAASPWFIKRDWGPYS